MSRQEKHAWFNLAVFATAAALFTLTATYIGMLPATGCFGICGLWGLGFLFYRKGTLDERELKIQRRGWQTGYSIFWTLFVIVIMLTWEKHKRGTVVIQGDILPLFIFGGMSVVVLTASVTTLLLYRWGILHAKS